MTLITLRSGNSGQWLQSNRILQSGEPGYDLSNRLLKIGDGVSNWANLGYYGSGLFSSINHNHSSLEITDFNNSISGLLPVKNILSSTGIFVTGIDGVYSVAVTGEFGLNESQVDSRVSGYLQAGSGIVLSYTNNSLTINSLSTGTGSSNINYSDVENAIDNYFDTFLSAGTGINFSYSNNTLTVSLNIVDVPISSSGSGSIGQFAYDNDYFYICINNNSWKKIGFNSW